MGLDVGKCSFAAKVVDVPTQLWYTSLKNQSGYSSGQSNTYGTSSGLVKTKGALLRLPTPKSWLKSVLPTQKTGSGGGSLAVS